MTKPRIPKITGSSKRSLDETLASIADHIPGAVVQDRKVIIPTAIIKNQPSMRQVKRIWANGGWQPPGGLRPKMRIAAATIRPEDERREESTSYSSMDKYYREYRQNGIVRRCINIKAMMATNKGAKTEVFHKDEKIDEEQHEALQKKYSKLIEFINDCNKKVNMDWIRRTALVGMQVHGRWGAEIDWENPKSAQEPPRHLLPLNGYTLKPEFAKDVEIEKAKGDVWTPISYEYEQEKAHFEPADVLYYPLNSLDGKQMGISEIEAVLDSAKAKRTLVTEVFPEAAVVSWSGVVVAQADTNGMTETAEDEFMTDFVTAFKPSKIVVVNSRITNIQVVSTNPNMDAMLNMAKYLDDEIIGYFEVPAALVARGREVNRATLYGQLDHFVNGPIVELQRTLRRLEDEKWNDMLARRYLGADVYDNGDIRVRTVWNPIKLIDFVDSGNTLANLKRSGALVQKTVYDYLGLNYADVEEDLLAQIELEKKTAEAGLQGPLTPKQAPEQAPEKKKEEQPKK